MELQQNLEALREAGIEPIGISYDSPEILKRFQIRSKIDFPLLSDPESEAIRAYSILNTEVANGRLAGVPYPATILIDQDGKVLAKLAHDGYRTRHTSAEILEAATAADASE